MILVNGFIPVRKEYLSRRFRHFFNRMRFKDRGDLLHRMYSYLCASANIAKCYGMAKGWLETTYRELAFECRVSLRTVMLYLKCLQSGGFIVLAPKVNKKRSARTRVFVLDPFPQKSQGKQGTSRSYIDLERDDKRATTPTPKGHGGDRLSSEEFRLKKLAQSCKGVLRRFCEAGVTTENVGEVLSPDDRRILGECFTSVEGIGALMLKLAADPTVRDAEAVLAKRMAKLLQGRNLTILGGKLETAGAQ